MKKTFLLLVLCLSSACLSGQQTGSFTSVDVETFEKVLMDDKSYVVLDVRTYKEYSEGHIPGTDLNIDVLASSFREEAVRQIPEGKTVALYCRSGSRSKKAASILAESGYQVLELGSGFKGWNAAGKGSFIRSTFVHDAIEYEYFLYKPASLPENAPLVMVFHGYGLDSFPALSYNINPVADKNGFAVCYPSGPKDHRGSHCWAVGYSFHNEKDWARDDVGFAVELVKHLQKVHHFSQNNVFATGHSNGGEMSYLLAYKAPHVFSAVAPISGLTMEWMYRELEATAPVPLFEIHGTEDVVSNWNGDPENEGGWGEYIAVPLAVSYWAAVNRCTHEIREELPLIGHKVIAHRYVNGIDGNQVWLYEVVGAGHAWTNNDLNIAEEIWKFFSMYLK